MVLLTVGVPCYNSEAYMEKCIDSLLKGGDRLEVIIIDDGSKDRTGEIADAYAEKYPSMVKVVHQENGGHGEGINQSIRHASGKYFKTVDSDDWLSDDITAFLDTLEALDSEGGVDLFVTNYYYDHADGKRNHSVTFKNALPVGRVFSWKELGHFRVDQLMMIHSCTFRTELLRKGGLEMPKHIFYEDNYMIYGNLRYVERIYYMDRDMYHYYIGRQGQSVQEDVMKRRYAHQLKATELCFTAFHLDEFNEKRKRNYLKHELFIMLAISAVYARLNGTDEAEKRLEEMWETCREFDEKWMEHFRYRTAIRLCCIPGRAGRALVRLIYRLSHIIVRFN